MEYLLFVIGIGAIALTAFVILDLRNQTKNIESEPVYYCRECEQINATEECYICGKDGARMPRGKAYKMLNDTNINRMIEWRDAGRIIPEVD